MDKVIKIAELFDLEGTVISAKEFGDGHINTTYSVDGKYVDMTASAENMRKYFNNNYHDLAEYKIGYVADFYNKMYMAGVCYADF